MKTSLLVVCALAGCGGVAAAPKKSPTPPAEPVVREDPHAEKLLAVAAEYLSYGRVDDEMRWAPGLCRAQSAGVARLSEAHDQKLYSVLARDRDQYFAATSPVGQVVVKESWKPERVTDTSALPSPYLWQGTADFTMGSGDHFYPYAHLDGEVWKASEPAGLYIMIKVGAPATPGTDEGWIYGTVSADGELTGAGVIDACKGCHVEAPRDRLFGLH